MPFTAWLLAVAMAVAGPVLWHLGRTERIPRGSWWGVNSAATRRDEASWRAGQRAAGPVNLMMLPLGVVLLLVLGLTTFPSTTQVWALSGLVVVGLVLAMVQRRMAGRAARAVQQADRPAGEPARARRGRVGSGADLSP